jgi:hypothetical protein
MGCMPAVRFANKFGHSLPKLFVMSLRYLQALIAKIFETKLQHDVVHCLANYSTVSA